MSKHDRRRGQERLSADTPFKKPAKVVIVSNPENGRMRTDGHPKRPTKKSVVPRQKHQTPECSIPRPMESVHDQVMDICSWMRDDGFVTDELHNDIYEPASKNETDILLTGIRKHIKTHDKKLMSYLQMMETIIEETDTGTSSAR